MLKKKPIENKDRELIGNSLHLLNEVDKFFEAYNKEIQRMIAVPSDRSYFELTRNNIREHMETLKTRLEKEN